MKKSNFKRLISYIMRESTTRIHDYVEQMIKIYFEEPRKVENMEQLKKYFSEYKDIYEIFSRLHLEGVMYTRDYIDYINYLSTNSYLFFNSLKLTDEMNEKLLSYKLTRLLSGSRELNKDNYLITVAEFELPFDVGENPPEFVKKYAYLLIK